jgi:hypothetical protein
MEKLGLRAKIHPVNDYVVTEFRRKQAWSGETVRASPEFSDIM